MPQPISSLGIGWYSREDYPRILQIMEDVHVLPPTYEVWREKAEDLESRAKSLGATVVRAIIKPNEFVVWCASHGMKVDAKARTAFGTEFSYRSLSPAMSVPRG
jgi:hypothetical protein